MIRVEIAGAREERWMSDLAPVERRLSEALDRIAQRLEKGAVSAKPSRGSVFGLGARPEIGPDPEQTATITSLREALESLQKDHAFLLEGDVFTKDQIEAYIDLKWDEVTRWETTPSPVEFDMYYSG
jgi:hypothetical protein